MKIVNRGFIAVRPKKPFVEWANQQDDEFKIDVDAEPTLYLIEEDFFEIEPIIEQNFKHIFLCELDAVSGNDDNFPEVNMERFLEWFSLEVGSTVIDLQKEDLIRE